MSLELSIKKFGEVNFKIGSEEANLTYTSAHELKSQLSEMLQYIEHWGYIYNYYESWFDPKIRKEKIKECLDNDEKNFEEDRKEYEVGGELASFTGDHAGNDPDYQFADNHEAVKKIEKLYTKKFGKHTLEFDSEMSCCYIYTKDRKEAEQFEEWLFVTIIKPKLNEIIGDSNVMDNKRK